MSRGGSTKNPFGGRQSLATLDLLSNISLGVDTTPEKLIYLSVIQDAVQQYLFFGLGKNGTTPDLFFESFNYLFKVRSTNQLTWYPNKYRLQTIVNGNFEYTKVTRLSDRELRNCCFDMQYQHSGLSKYMSIEKFLARLKTERLHILTNNYDQVEEVVNSIRAVDIKELDVGTQLSLSVLSLDIISILTYPESPQQLARLLYVPGRAKELSKRK